MFSWSKSRPREAFRPSFRALCRWLRSDSLHTESPSPLFPTRKEPMQPSQDVSQFGTSEEGIFGYQAQRWLWNEQDQLQQRYLRFDLSALAMAAEKAVGPGADCREITKLPEGNFNKTLLVRMQNGKQLIARLPNPNAGHAHYTTASEVATMDYVRDRLQIPVPKVLAYNTRADSNPVGAEYIIMEKCPGIELGRFWGQMSGKEKIEVVKQVAALSAKLSNARFPYYGSLYYAKDIPDIKGTEVDDIFSVGPTTSRTWFDDRRREVEVHRGPWASVKDVLTAIAAREAACLDAFPDVPQDRQQGIFNGPGGYQPSKAFKKSVIGDYSRILPHIIPKDEAFTASILWHNDLHLENIFVNEHCPTEITGIIDWQCVPLYPAFMHVYYPSLLQHDGPELEGLQVPRLPPDFESLDEESQKSARKLHQSQSLWVLYKTFVHKQAPDLLRLLHYHDTLPCQIMNIAGALYEDGEPYTQRLITQLSDPNTWKEVVEAAGQSPGGIPCPLKYSDEEVSKQENQMAKWEKDIERKARVFEDVGAYTGWDGAVVPEQYSEVSEALRVAKARFLDAEAKTPEERAQWERAWPFQDKKQ